MSREVIARGFCPDCGARLVEDAGARPACPECGYVAYRNPVVGVAMVVRDGEARVLMGRRARGDYAGLWCIPCGYVEWGEEVRAAAERELQEETALAAKTGEVIAVHSNFHNEKQYTVGIWFSATDVSGVMAPVDGEFSELRYFEPGMPPPLAFPTDALVLEQLGDA